MVGMGILDRSCSSFGTYSGGFSIAGMSAGIKPCRSFVVEIRHIQRGILDRRRSMRKLGVVGWAIVGILVVLVIILLVLTGHGIDVH